MYNFKLFLVLGYEKIKIHQVEAGPLIFPKHYAEVKNQSEPSADRPLLPGIFVYTTV